MIRILRLIGITFAIACILGILTSGIGWLLKWNSTTEFSNGFFGAGAILIVLGILSVMGGYGMRSNFSVVYSQSAGDMNTLERTKRWIADMSQGYASFLLLLLTGAYLVGFAILIPNVFS